MNTTLHFNVTTGPTLGQNLVSTTPIGMVCEGKSNFT